MRLKKCLLVFLLGIFLISSVLAQADICVEDSTSLGTNARKIYLNDQLNVARTIITRNELPNLLADRRINNVGFRQSVEIGSDPKVIFAKQPTSENDPDFGLRFSTTPQNFLYKTIVNFDQPIDFSDSNLNTQVIELFNSRFIFFADRTPGKLNLLKDARKLSLSNNNIALNEVEFGGGIFTIELLAASDTAATIQVTDPSGNSLQREVSERTHLLINGLIIFLNDAEESNFQISAVLVAALSKNLFSISDSQSVLAGPDRSIIEGTRVNLEGEINALSAIEISVSAPDSDEDALLTGEKFIDPIYGFSLNLDGIANDENREDINVESSGTDKMTVNFRSHDGSEATSVFWAYNPSNTNTIDLADNDGDKIVVGEMLPVRTSEYFVLASDDQGGLYEVKTISDSSAGFVDDYVRLQNVFTGDEIEFRATAQGVIEGVGQQGQTYTITYTGSAITPPEDREIRVNFGESLGSERSMIVFPTIATQKGAKVAFYEPLTIDLNNWDGNGNALDTLLFPDGDGYTSVLVSKLIEGLNRFSVGNLDYRLMKEKNILNVFLQFQDFNIESAALIIFEETDHNLEYNAIIAKLQLSNGKLGLDDIIRTWSSDLEWDNIQLASNSNLFEEADVYGTVIRVDKSDNAQQNALVKYPDEQVYADISISSVCEIVAQPRFIRGDADSSGNVDISDAIRILNYLFLGRQVPTCLDAADANDNGQVELTDAIRILNFLFRGGPAPLAPYPVSGVDPTDDNLGCSSQNTCGNALLEAGEECDDGNNNGNDFCDNSCRLVSTCGNALLEFGEQCDDGNNINNDLCDNLCRLVR